ncbi:hypothetical protein [Hymenobacter elongatus]|uniref:Uncharacterized protein n=1 Tax=Hymenobacter elongatus TaxID=877208 RepID=A0A4Z0PMG5_9BACT|nr:hypothetical protein [Hymenobacter elongatus]TGE15988.1 hypothetical protein E5J99_11200 [Hymenobacter elongatus]
MDTIDIKGVVLFADDRVHSDDEPEYELYKLFKKEFVVLPVDNLDHLKQALTSVSTFDVIILDWEFLSHDPDFVDAPPQNPLSILEELKLFSKIFVYSAADIPADAVDRLHILFPGRVVIKQKVIKIDERDALLAEFEEIKKELKEFALANQNLDFSVAWGRAINQSLQSIFGELAAVNKHWVRDIYKSSVKDNSNAISEVIELLNNLLAEQLVQNPGLKAMILTQGNENGTNTSELAAAKLFQRIYYTKIHGTEVPFATGDIFEISDDEYAILITPECEVYIRDSVPAIPKSNLEILRFSKKDITAEFGIDKGLDKFNQNATAKHYLPSFPYRNEAMLLPACIVFLTALETVSKDFLTDLARHYKLNSPYIQQLRQRYSSWHGRVGVPAVNDLIKTFNASQVDAYNKRLEHEKPKASPEEIALKKALAKQEKDASGALRKAAYEEKKRLEQAASVAEQAAPEQAAPEQK